MTFEHVIFELSEKKYRSVYFLMGEEPYFIDHIVNYMAEHTLKPEERAFNQIVLYGRDTDIRNILSTARRFPVMSPYLLIIVKEAQQLHDLNGLDNYLEKPVESTILVFAYKHKKIDKRTKLAKALAEKCFLFESDKIREDKVPAWIAQHLRNKGYQAELKSASLLVDYLGNDLARIENELNKLLLVLPVDTKEITPEMIEKHIGISKDYNNFELTRALALKDTLKAQRIVKYFGQNPRNNPYMLTLSSLFYYFTKILQYHSLPGKQKEHVAKELGINPYFVAEYQQAAKNYPLQKARQVIGLLREYDLKSKGNSTASEGELLKELIYRILH
jgi:DNA polymerase-3 subunit delta